MDCTVHGILQATILEWVAFPFSRGSSQPRDRTQVSRIAGGFFTSSATREAWLQASQGYKSFKWLFLVPWLYPPWVYSHLDQAVFARDCQKVDPGRRQVLCCHAAKQYIRISHWLATSGHLQRQQCLYDFRKLVGFPQGGGRWAEALGLPSLWGALRPSLFTQHLSVPVYPAPPRDAFLFLENRSLPKKTGFLGWFSRSLMMPSIHVLLCSLQSH